MLFTIAIPTFNNIKTIENTFKSCLGQDYENEYEILIVDNCCTDGSDLLFKNWSNTYKNVKVIRDHETVSLFENHNVCLRNAIGKYVLFCHSDDCLNVNALKLLEKKIIEKYCPDKYVLWGSSLFRDFYVNLSNTGIHFNQILSGERAYLPFFYGGLTPSGTCYSRKIFIEKGGFLKQSHKCAHCDATTMLFLANDGFEFEMMDRIIFLRRDASTAIRQGSFDNECIAWQAAIEELIKKVGEEQFLEISRHSLTLQNIPLAYYIVLLNFGYFKKEILKNFLRPKNLIRALLYKNYRILLKALIR